MTKVFVLVWLWSAPEWPPDRMHDHTGPLHHPSREACEREAAYRHPPPLWHGEAPSGHLCIEVQRDWAGPPFLR